MYKSEIVLSLLAQDTVITELIEEAFKILKSELSSVLFFSFSYYKSTDHLHQYAHIKGVCPNF